jgi:succinoglycan biosynthesis transport protein ExoP
VAVELSDYVGVLRRRWWIVALAIVLCTVGAGVLSTFQPKVYASSVRLLIPSGTGANRGDREAATAAATAFAQLAMTGPALDAAISATGREQIGVSVVATTDGLSPFLTITAQSGDPAAAQAVANAYIRTLPGIVLSLNKDNSNRLPQLTVLKTAELPNHPSSPRPKRSMLIGAVLGLVLGLAVGLLRETLDGRVRSGVQLERAAEVALLGLVPKEFRSVPVPAMSRPRSRRAEAYRAVRTNLEFLSVQGMPHSIVITSAAAGEGKSSLSANLGITASRAGRDVVIIDADLRKPTVSRYFDLTSPIGLTDVLVGRWSVDEALQQVPGERLCVLTSGPVPAAPGELVGSAAMAALIEELEHRFDLVIIDTPPILPVSDGLSLAVNVDGVVLVARMRETTRRSVQKAAEALRKVNATLVGVVGNVAVANGEDEIYGYADGYRSKAPLQRVEAADLADEVQPLEAAGRRARREQQRVSTPQSRREHRMSGTRRDSAEPTGPHPLPVPGSPQTNPRGIGGLTNDSFPLRPRPRGSRAADTDDGQWQ